MRTFTYHLGLCWDTKLKRWHHVNKHFVGMGGPTDERLVQIAGETCQVSRHMLAPPGRTRRSSANQLGNAMHVGVIGPLVMAVNMWWPEVLGMEAVKEAPTNAKLWSTTATRPTRRCPRSLLS